MTKQLIKIAFLSLLIHFLSSCTPKPEEINFGTDPCDYCKMTIADPKFGAELVTEKGRVYMFDAIECMVNYKEENKNPDYAYVMAIAYDDPKKLFPVDELFFVIDEQYKSPMGKNLAAFKNRNNIRASSDLMDWDNLKIALNR